MRLIVGLGNPGDAYCGIRHNTGFMVLDKLAGLFSVGWKEGFQGEYAAISVQDEKRYLLKPMTYMNLSGAAVGEFCRYFKLEPADIILVHDELDFPYGKIKFSMGGSGGGHNGVISVISHLGTEIFCRLRMGIAGINRAEMKGYTKEYVLSAFTAAEKDSLADFVALGAEAALFALENGVRRSMEKYNRRANNQEVIDD